MAGLYLRLDTNFWSHPKVIAAGEQAAVLYQQMAMYCMDHATDGLVPDGQLPRFGLPRLRHRLARLADAGLAEQVDGGWLLPGYVERYKTAAEVADLREKRRKAGKQGGRPKKQPEEPPCLDDEKANGNQVAFAMSNPKEKEEGKVAKEPPPQVTPVVDEPDPTWVVAQQLVDQLGYRNQRPPAQLANEVHAALTRGDTPEGLASCAAAVLAMPPEQIQTTAVKVLMGLLHKRNSEPLETARNGVAAAPAERRGRLDDERPPCACGGSGIVGGLDADGLPDGSPTSYCPACHVLGATA